MIGTLDRSNKEVAIVGAGISGLLSAYYLDKAGYQVTLLEEKERAGGLIRSTFTELGLAESAAHSLIATSAVRELCRDLKVELIAPRKEASAKYIVRDGKLRRFPLSIGELAATAGRAAFARSTINGDQSLEEWGNKHLGAAAVDYLLTPFVRGIYGVQPGQLGVAAAYPSLAVSRGDTLLTSVWKHRKRKGKKRESHERVAPLLGMGELTSRLETHLEERLGDRFQRGRRVTSLPDAPNVVITTPAYAAANLLALESPQLASQLHEVRYTPLVSITVFVDRAAFTRGVEGVGALMPARENRNCLGILFNSSSFTNRVRDDEKVASFTVMMGGTNQPEWLSANDELLRSTVRSELSQLLGIKELLEIVVHRWPAALPQYGGELPRIWETARSTWCATRGKILFGNYTGQISLRGMIESAAQLAA